MNCNCDQATALRAFVERAAFMLDKARDHLRDDPSAASFRLEAEVWIGETNASPYCELPEPPIVREARALLAMSKAS